MIDLKISEEGFSQIVDELGATPQQCQKALKSTLSKMSKWMRTRTTRGLSKELQMQLKIIRRRFKNTKVVSTSDGYSIRLWYGLNEVSLIHLNAKKTRRGVSAYGGRKIDGAFIAKGQVFKRRGKSRLPVEKQAVPIQEQANEFLEGAISQSQFDTQFFKTFEHELKWQTRS